MRTDPSSTKSSSLKPSKTSALDEYKIRASKLLKDLASADKRRAFEAAHRLARLWPERKAGDVLAGKSEIKRKHALATIAREAGFRDWDHLKSDAEVRLPPFDTTRLFPQSTGVYLNAWFASYEEAREALKRKGRFLFPYRTQFVVCEAALLESQGIDAHDPDWDAIGRDWVKPLDPDAFERLNGKLGRIVPPLPPRRTRLRD